MKNEFRRGLYVWVPVKAVPAQHGVYVAKEYEVTSAGSSTLHLKGADDVDLGFAYQSKGECFDRCKKLFTIFTMRPESEYPAHLL